MLFHQVFSPSLSFTDESDVHVFNSVQVVYEPRPQWRLSVQPVNSFMRFKYIGCM